MPIHVQVRGHFSSFDLLLLPHCFPLRRFTSVFSMRTASQGTVRVAVPLYLSYSALLSAEPVTCNHKDFACASGDCISARFRCDGDYDCADNSDEVSECWMSFEDSTAVVLYSQTFPSSLLSQSCLILVFIQH